MNLTRLLTSIWNAGPLRNTRRNHAIEHATIHLLSRRVSDTRLAGRSTHRGFYIYGNVPTEVLEQTTREAIERLQCGEHELAIHPHCGTNLVTASVLAGMTTAFALAGKRRRWWDKLLSALVATTVALAASQPLGYWLQEYVTTEATVSQVDVAHIRRFQVGNMTVHFVRIVHSA